MIILQEDKSFGLFYNNGVLEDWSMCYFGDQDNIKEHKLINSIMIRYYNKIWKYNCLYDTGHQYLDVLIQRSIFYGSMCEFCGSKKQKIYKKLYKIYKKKGYSIVEFIKKNYDDDQYEYEKILNKLLNSGLPFIYADLIQSKS